MSDSDNAFLFQKEAVPSVQVAAKTPSILTRSLSHPNQISSALQTNNAANKVTSVDNKGSSALSPLSPMGRLRATPKIPEELPHKHTKQTFSRSSYADAFPVSLKLYLSVNKSVLTKQLLINSVVSVDRVLRTVMSTCYGTDEEALENLDVGLTQCDQLITVAQLEDPQEHRNAVLLDPMVSMNALGFKHFRLASAQNSKYLDSAQHNYDEASASTIVFGGATVVTKKDDSKSSGALSYLDQLMEAIVRDDLATVQRVVSGDNNVTVNDQTKAKWTGLHFAAKAGNLGLVRHLLKNGADVDMQTENGWTALHLAIFHNHIDVYDMLVMFEADLSIRTQNDETALDIAKRCRHKEIIEALSQ